MEFDRKLQLQIVDSSEEFYKLKSNWNKILSELGECPPFLTWEWMYTWWEIYKTDATKLLLLVVLDNSNIIAIAPFYIRKGALIIPCKTIYFLGSGEPESKEVCSEYLDIIAIPSYAKAASGIVVSYLVENSAMWDRLQLQRILKKSLLLDFFIQDITE